MNQQKHIVIAFFVLVFIGSVVFFALNTYRSASNDTIDNSPVIIDYASPSDTTVEKGRKLYQKVCASCHFIFKDLTGPALAGIEAKWKNKKELIAYIRNSEKASPQNPNVIRIRKEYNTRMPIFSSLTDKEVQSILDYIAFEEKKKGIPVPSSTK